MSFFIFFGNSLLYRLPRAQRGKRALQLCEEPVRTVRAPARLHVHAHHVGDRVLHVRPDGRARLSLFWSVSFSGGT